MTWQAKHLGKSTELRHRSSLVSVAMEALGVLRVALQSLWGLRLVGSVVSHAGRAMVVRPPGDLSCPSQKRSQSDRIFGFFREPLSGLRTGLKAPGGVL